MDLKSQVMQVKIIQTKYLSQVRKHFKIEEGLYHSLHLWETKIKKKKKKATKIKTKQHNPEYSRVSKESNH